MDPRVGAVKVSARMAYRWAPEQDPAQRSIRRYPVMSFRRHAPGATPAHWRNAWLNEASDA